MTTSRAAWRWNALSLGSLVAIACVVWLVWRLQNVLLILVASVFLAYVLDPLVARLSRLPLGGERRLGRKAASAVIVLLAIYAVAQGVYWFVPVLWAEFQRLGSELPKYYAMGEQWLRTQSDRHGMGLPPEVWARLQAEWHNLLERGAGHIGSSLAGVLGAAGSLLGILVVPIGAFYILADGGALARGFVDGLPAGWRDMARRLLSEADRSLATYVRGQTLVVIVASALACALFTALGIRYSLALGILAGLAEAVPFLGSIAVVASLALVCSDRGPEFVLIGVGAYVALNQVNNYLISPRLMSAQLALHPFIVILAVLAGTSLGGVLGAVLALPTTALLIGLGGVLWGAGRPEKSLR